MNSPNTRRYGFLVWFDPRTFDPGAPEGFTAASKLVLRSRPRFNVELPDLPGRLYETGLIDAGQMQALQLALRTPLAVGDPAVPYLLQALKGVGLEPQTGVVFGQDPALHKLARLLFVPLLGGGGERECISHASARECIP
jgi:hypothetical protein